MIKATVKAEWDKERLNWCELFNNFKDDCIYEDTYKYLKGICHKRVKMAEYNFNRDTRKFKYWYDLCKWDKVNRHDELRHYWFNMLQWWEAEEERLDKVADGKFVAESTI